MTDAETLLLLANRPAEADRISQVLMSSGRFQVLVETTLVGARKRLDDSHPALLIALPRITDGDSLELLRDCPEQPMLMLDPQPGWRRAAAAFKAGALDYLPLSTGSLENLPTTIDRLLQLSAQRRAEQAATGYAAHFGRVLASSLTEIYTFDATSLRFIRANRGARMNLGYSKDELRGLTPFDLKPDVDRETFLAWLDQLRSGEREGMRFETRHRRKDGSLYPVEVQLHYSRTEPPVFVAVVLDISDRKRAEERLLESEARFRSIFDSAAAGLAILTPRGELLEVNPYFCEFTGYPVEEMVGRNIIDFTHPEDRRQTENYYAALQQDPQQIVTIEKRYLRKDGQVRWGHASITCVPGQGTVEPYCIGLVQDITRHKESEEKMRDAYAELDAFVRTVAHDLRNPLTPIIGMAEFLQEHSSEVLDETAMDFLHDIEASGQRMLALLEDLLALARVGHVRDPVRPVETSRVLDEVLLNLGPQIASAGVTIESGQLSPLFLPETLVSQIFDNLVGNAVRYAGRPGTTIEIREEVEETRLLLRVIDHGPGIPEEERGHIFEVFYRGSSSKGTRGTGIGLATVRKIARLYGGDVTVAETPGGGCSFKVELPVAVLSCAEGERLVG